MRQARFPIAVIRMKRSILSHQTTGERTKQAYVAVPQGEAVKHSPQKSGATLRQATIFALDTLIAFSKNAHEESYFGDISSSEEKVCKMGFKTLGGNYVE